MGKIVNPLPSRRSQGGFPEGTWLTVAEPGLGPGPPGHHAGVGPHQHPPEL